MSLTGGRSGGGGGGFGGFPYRGAHQQGTDGGGGRGGGRRHPRSRRGRRSNNNSHNCRPLGADVSVAASRRGRLIGRGGRVIQNLTRATGASVRVPPKRQQQRRTTTSTAPRQQQQQETAEQQGGAATATTTTTATTAEQEANTNNQEGEDTLQPVYVKAATISSLLHALWRILWIVDGDDDDDDDGDGDDDAGKEERGGTGNDDPGRTTKLACRVRLPEMAAAPIPGFLTQPPSSPSSGGHDGCFLTLENGLSAHCIEATTTATTTTHSSLEADGCCWVEQIDTLVDNERFAHPERSARYCVVVAEEQQQQDSEAAANAANNNNTTILVFVYGAESQHPAPLASSLDESIRKLRTASVVLARTERNERNE